MKNHILLAILAVLIATSQTMAYNDVVNQEEQKAVSTVPSPVVELPPHDTFKTVTKWS